MPDTKITALTALTAADPANDVLPIVDVSDTTMAASGTTKKISINNVLGCSGTATLASATITGNLTVDTNTLFVDAANNCVGVGTTTPTVYANYKTLALVGGSSGFVIDAHATGGGTAGGMQIAATPTGTNFDVFGPNAGTAAPAVIRTGTFGSVSERYRIAGDGVATWSNVGGVAGTAMTLNSTGLGVGVTPTAGRGAVQLSAGVGFPATQVASTDPNTLDDYEEGTWTATLNGGTTNPTTPVTATGRYTKIGRQVHIQLAIVSANTTGASGSVQITGVPFAPGEISFGVLQSELGITFTGTLGCYIAASATTIIASASASASGRTDGTHNAGTDRFFWLNITYTV